MGQTLSEPITEKHSSKDNDKRFAYGASAMQGWRLSILFFLKNNNNYDNTGFLFRKTKKEKYYVYFMYSYRKEKRKILYLWGS